MDSLIKISEGFARDSNGKYHVLPMKIPESIKLPSWTQKSGEKSARRKFIPLPKLKFTPSQLKQLEGGSNAKRRKTEPVRKELFKMPQKQEQKRVSVSRKSVAKSSNKTMFARKSYVPNKATTAVPDTPLIDVDEAERLLRLMQKPLVLFPITSIKEEQEQSTQDAEKHPANSPDSFKSDAGQYPAKSPNSFGSDAEFLHLEQELASTKKEKSNSSPLSNVCALLNNTKLSSGKKSRKNPTSTLDTIASIIKQDEEHFQLVIQQFETYKIQRQISVNRIVDLVKGMNEDKENIRRSPRIAHKEDVVSPGVIKREDLRKRTLNKNLVKSIQFQSPRTQKAVDLYNTIKNDCSVLCTPKLSTSNADFPRTSVTRSLSRRLQKQCLLLQDTPGNKL